MSIVDERQRYLQGLEAWRDRLDKSLRAEQGWLSLVGLHWLRAGVNSLGGAAENDMIVSGGPDHIGVVELGSQGVIFQAAEGIAATVDGQPATQVLMQPDTSDEPTRLTVGNLTMVVIQRGGRFGLRIWDRHAQARQAFPGRQWFAIDPDYRLEGRFVPYDPPRRLVVADVTGGTQETASPGEVVFAVWGEAGRLVASSGDEDGLFLIFADATNGSTTYPAGRYLVTSAPEEGVVEIDFNRAYNPPCAFTPYATCPLPLPGNRLALAIEAGERDVLSSAR